MSEIPTMRAISRRNPASGVHIINKSDFNPDRWLEYNPAGLTREQLRDQFISVMRSAGYDDATQVKIFDQCFERYCINPEGAEELFQEFENSQNQGAPTVNAPNKDRFELAIKHVISKGYAYEAAESIVNQYGVTTILEGKELDEKQKQAEPPAPAPAPVPVPSRRRGVTSGRNNRS